MTQPTSAPPIPPCPDTPENRKELMDVMLAKAQYVQEAKKANLRYIECLPFLLVALDGQLHHARACDCNKKAFVIAEYARGVVALIEKPFGDVVWIHPEMLYKVRL